MTVIVLIIILASAFVLQILTGGFPIAFFAFPLNLICALIWASAVLWLWKDMRRSLFVSFMLSPSASISSIILLLVCCLVVGLTGMRWIVQSWVFITVLLYFQTVLAFVLLRGWRAATPTGARLGPIRWRFVLLHLGLLVTVSSAFWGAPDSQTCRMKAVQGVPTAEAFLMDGTPAWLEYEIELKDFNIEKYESDVPSDFSAHVLVDGESITLRVNHPYKARYGEHVYLSGYDVAAGAGSEYCILQIVRETWRPWCMAGILMMLAGAFMLFIGGPRRNNNVMD